MSIRGIPHQYQVVPPFKIPPPPPGGGGGGALERKAACEGPTSAREIHSAKARLICKAGRRLGVSWTRRPGTVAGRGVEVAVAGGLLVVVGFGVGALGAVVGRVGDLDKAPAVDHKAPTRGGPPIFFTGVSAILWSLL